VFLDLVEAGNGGLVSRKLSSLPPVMVLVVAATKKSSVPLSKVPVLQAISRLC